ncbi:hypothetical protein [Nostoc flagelliforme]|uniref:hypothetical protein n=1 Tax=Nostoc flagelliforme TaxID=1306274 RepID=UPI001AC003F3|nr:hypothetical protein [Nostoc flagelliforme]
MNCFGQGGDIDITTNRLFIRNNARVTSSSIGTGEAGDIRIRHFQKIKCPAVSIIFLAQPIYLGAFALKAKATAKHFICWISLNANFLEIIGKDSAIASFTNAGNGGDITLDIADLLLLRAGGFISTTAGRSQAGGNGGNININSKFIVAIPKENSDISANAYTGSGGRVEINSQGIFGIESRTKPTEKSDITASSQLGISGITNINAPDTTSIQNSFTGESPNVIDTNAHKSIWSY